jgi:hypothetical protein
MESRPSFSYGHNALMRKLNGKGIRARKSNLERMKEYGKSERITLDHPAFLVAVDNTEQPNLPHPVNWSTLNESLWNGAYFHSFLTMEIH